MAFQMGTDGMIEVEKFGGGALRVSYRDGRDDWMFWPFEKGVDCAAALVVGEDRVLAVEAGVKETRTSLYDTKKRSRLAYRRMAKGVPFAARNGIYIALDMITQEGWIKLINGHDLTDILSFEDPRLDIRSVVYHRFDDKIVIGTPAGPKQATWIIGVENGKPAVESFDGRMAPQGLHFGPLVGNSHKMRDPTGRRAVSFGPARVPIEKKGREVRYGVPLCIWDLQTLEIERTLIVDNLPPELSSYYRGRDRQRAGHKERISWEGMTAALDPSVWDGDLQLHRNWAELRDASPADPASSRRDFMSSYVADLAWQQDGQGLWVLFSAGFLRHVSVDGTISPRHVIQRLATPPALGQKRYKPRHFFHRQEANTLACLANGSLRIESQYVIQVRPDKLAELFAAGLKGGVSEFNPARFRRHGFLGRLFGLANRDLHLSRKADGFVSSSVTKRGGTQPKKLSRAEKAVEKRKAEFLKLSAEQEAASKVRQQWEAEQEDKERKAARLPGSIDVEKFGYTCGGALRVEFVGSGEDWMFLPFRDRDLKEFHVLGEDRILAYAPQQLALFDARKKECVARRRVGVNLKLHPSANGEQVSLIGKMDGERESLTILSGHDLQEISRLEEEGLSNVRPVYEREDGALLIGGMTEGPAHTVYVVTFEGGMPKVEKRDETALPGSYKANWPCPMRRRILALTGDRIPVIDVSGEKSFCISLDIWNLTTLERERTAVAEQLHADHQAIQEFALAEWDGSLRPDPSLDEGTRSKILGLGRRWNTLVEKNLRAVAWDPDGEAFWCLFADGHLRRVSCDGSRSPRVVIERLWAPGLTRGGPDLRDMSVLPDGRVRIEFYGIAADRKRQFVCFEPPAAAIPGEGSAPDIMIRESEDGLGEVFIGYPTVDEGLKARMKAFEERAQDAPFVLADMSAASCIAAIERLTEAIERDPYELVCGYTFRPVFVLSTDRSPEKRMGEDEFFAHVAANAPEARDAIERLLHMWMDKVPLSAKHRNYYLNDETVALSHALKALITLDPCCYGTIRRYVTELDFEHDVIVQREILPYFAKLNGWRDGDAIKLGIFCMLGAWSGGSDGAWIDEAMKKRVEQAMNGREFAGVLIRETERYFSPDEASFNQEAWDHNHVRGYLEFCETYNFRTKSAFDREAVAAINEYLKREPR